MRLILTTILLTVLVQPVYAKTNLELYKECKPFANNGFSFAGLSETQQFGAIACSAFQAGVIHLAQFVCHAATNPVDRQLFGTSITSTQVLTQRFINWAEANPDKWEYTADPSWWIVKTCEEK